MSFQSLIKHFKARLDEEIIEYHPVSGGDINEAYELITVSQKYFVKLNRYPHGQAMLNAEAKGLLAIEEKQCIPAARVVDQDTYTGFSYLILEWIASGSRSESGWERFGEQLATLHKNTFAAYGFQEDNFIGSLAQSNRYHDRWQSFYSEERIMPQVKKAMDQHYFNHNDILLANSLCLKLNDICPEEPPSLIHGDLWSGNYMFNKSGIAVLIDPAVSYAHREMDLAMSKLFGGFHPEFYLSYEEEYPLQPGFEDRVEIYQLYYLLVHLNLFGTSYLSSCQRILKKFG